MWRCIAAVFCLGVAMLHAQTLQVITLQEHLARLPHVRDAVNLCALEPARCAALGDAIADESFPLPNGVQTHVSYAWLRQAMTRLATPQNNTPAKPPTPGSPTSQEVRRELAASLLTRLQNDADTSTLPVPPTAARGEANRVLSEVEFARSKPGLLQQQWQRFTDWLNRRLSSNSSVRGAGQWLTFLLEAALFGVPLLLLGLWLLRQVREDRLRPASLPNAATGAPLKAAAWSDVAQRHAENAEWREAVHALYWQSIAGFEQRHIWSVARHRTPREYLRLLEAGSPRRTLLREQTLLLEAVWYGRAPATEEQFRHARRLTEELSLA